MKKWLSFLGPQIIREKPTKQHGKLVIAWENGRKVLNSGSINYSYGSLQKILEQGLQKTLMGKSPSSILVLGLGAGSVIETLRKTFLIPCPITAIEIDEEMILIAREEFDLDSWQEVEIIQEDAFEFLKRNEQAYDLIIVDLFFQNQIPTAGTSLAFIQDLARSTRRGGFGIFNTLRETMPLSDRISLQQKLESVGMKIRILEEVGFTNDLILFEKKE